MTTFALGNINSGSVCTPTVQSLLLAAKYFHYRDWAGDERFDPLHDVPTMSTVILHMGGPYLDDGRNIVVAKFLSECDSDILIFVDSDVEFSPFDILRLLDHDYDKYPIISGAYRNLFSNTISTYPNPGWSPVVYLPHENGNGRELMPIGDDGWHLLPTTDDPNLYHANVVGAGFLAIHRRVLDHMGSVFGTPCPWFAEPITPDLIHLGEDTGFCQRAIGLDYPVVVDERIRLNHTKSISISGLTPPTVKVN